MNTFTTQEIKEHYDSYMGYMSECQGKNPQTFPEWLDELYKPTKKVIDLSVLIKSGIDCEFWDDETDQSVYKLTSINCCSYPYEAKGESTRFCRPRMNHIHAWDGGECPLPEGFVVEVWWRDGTDDIRTINSGNGLYWGHNNHASDIIHFKVLRLADGYVMPWEVEL